MVVEPLDQALALAIASRIRHLGGGAHKTIEAHVVHAARTRGWRVFTRDPDPLWHLDTDLICQTPPPS